MKKTAISLAYIIVLSVVFLYTTAYFSDSVASPQAVMQAGSFEIGIRSTRVDQSTGNAVEDNAPIPVMPATTAQKTVTVCNFGDFPAYIRFKPEVRFQLSDGLVAIDTQGLVGLDISDQHWIEQDGWYYYYKPLAVGSESEPVFTTVSFSAEMDDRYENSQVIVQVTVDAVQSNNNGASAFEASGWPSVSQEGSHE